MGPVLTSARKTGRVVVVHEAPVTLGLGSEIAARVTEECFYALEAPVIRVGGFDTPYPPSRIEEEYLPDLDRVLDAVDRLWPIAEAAGLTMAQLCLAWVLRQDNVAAAIVGASRPEQVHENAAAADVELSDDTMRAIDEALLLVAVT